MFDECMFRSMNQAYLTDGALSIWVHPCLSFCIAQLLVLFAVFLDNCMSFYIDLQIMVTPSICYTFDAAIQRAEI